MLAGHGPFAPRVLDLTVLFPIVKEGHHMFPAPMTPRDRHSAQTQHYRGPEEGCPAVKQVSRG